MLCDCQCTQQSPPLVNRHPPHLSVLGALPCGTSGQFSFTSPPSSVAHTLMLLVNTKLPVPSHCLVAAATCRNHSRNSTISSSVGSTERGLVV